MLVTLLIKPKYDKLTNERVITELPDNSSY